MNDPRSSSINLQAIARQVMQAQGFQPDFPPEAQKQLADIKAHPPQLTPSDKVLDLVGRRQLRRMSLDVRQLFLGLGRKIRLKTLRLHDLSRDCLKIDGRRPRIVHKSSKKGYHESPGLSPVYPSLPGRSRRVLPV